MDALTLSLFLEVHDLEGKINSEMAFLRERMHTMTSTLDELQDIEGLKAKVQHRQTELTSEREELLTLKPQLTSQVNELEREYENIQVKRKRFMMNL